MYFDEKRKLLIQSIGNFLNIIADKGIINENVVCNTDIDKEIRKLIENHIKD